MKKDMQVEFSRFENLLTIEELHRELTQAIEQGKKDYAVHIGVDGYWGGALAYQLFPPTMAENPFKTDPVTTEEKLAHSYYDSQCRGQMLLGGAGVENLRRLPTGAIFTCPAADFPYVDLQDLEVEQTAAMREKIQAALPEKKFVEPEDFQNKMGKALGRIALKNGKNPYVEMLHQVSR